MQEKLAQVKQEAEDMKGRLSELDLEVEQKTNRLAEVELRLKDSLAERAEEEERLSRRLRDSQEVIASLKAQPHQVKVRMALCSVQGTGRLHGPFCPSSQLWGGLSLGSSASFSMSSKRWKLNPPRPSRPSAKPSRGTSTYRTRLGCRGRC